MPVPLIPIIIASTGTLISVINNSNDFNGIIREASLSEFLNGANGITVCHFNEKFEQLTFLDNKNLLSDFWQKIKELKLKNFAIWCKTGLRESSQVNKIIEALIVLCSEKI